MVARNGSEPFISVLNHDAGQCLSVGSELSRRFEVRVVVVFVDEAAHSIP